jgi:RsiW-degrading membrane proteinase PrsW (M82 family)
MKCENCGNEVPEGVFCTICGTHQGTTPDLTNKRTRETHFAAAPGEHVGHPSILTTLFPHLGHHKVHEFRIGLIAGVVVLVILLATGLIGPAIVVSAFLVPLLYILYLYEAQVYGDEPVPVMLFTVGAGIVLGLVLTFLVIKLIPNPAPTSGLTGVTQGTPGIDWTSLVLLTVLVPVVQEIVKPLVPYALLRRRFPETLDGLVFGVAAGVGFGLAETLVRYFSLVITLPLKTESGEWIFQLAQLSILNPLLQGTAAGLYAAALWRLGKGKATSRDLIGIPVAIGGHVLYSFVGELLRRGPGESIEIAWQLLVVLGLIVYLRYVLHHALLSEAEHHGFREVVCPNCHRHVLASNFCSNCGVSLTAGPKHLRKHARHAGTAVGGEGGASQGSPATTTPTTGGT